MEVNLSQKIQVFFETLKSAGLLDISFILHPEVLEVLREMIPFTKKIISGKSDGIADDIPYKNCLVGVILSPDISSFGDLGPPPSDLFRPVKIRQEKVVYGNEFPEVFESFAFIVARNRQRVLVGILPSERFKTKYPIIFFGWLPNSSIQYVNVVKGSERFH
jgi:hypothetical protein